MHHKCVCVYVCIKEYTYVRQTIFLEPRCTWGLRQYNVFSNAIFCLGKSQCPYPGDPPNGLLAPLKFNYDSGDYISVQCRPGYVQYSENGPPERPKCQPDGHWSGPVPKCRSYEEV